MPREPTLSVLVTRNVLDTAARHGVASEALLADAGVDPAVVADVDARIPVRRHIALFALAVERSGVPGLALEVGANVRPGTLHLLGYAAMSSPTLGEAYLRMERYWHLVAEGTRFVLDATGPEARLTFEVTDGSLPFPRHGAEANTVSRVTMGRWLTGEDWAPLRVEFPWPRPSYAADYERVFRCPVHFGGPAATVVLSRELLALPLVQANPGLCAHFDGMAEAALARFQTEPPVVAALRQALASRLPVGVPHVAEAARQLGMSARTLQRRLREADRSFQAVVDETRREVCLRLLKDPALTLDEVAYMAGFAETSSFHRAFRRWTGRTPSGHRAAGGDAVGAG